MAKGLLLFKEIAARSYAFDPVTGIPERDQKLLAESQTRRRDELMRKLQGASTELTEIRPPRSRKGNQIGQFMGRAGQPS